MTRKVEGNNRQQFPCTDETGTLKCITDRQGNPKTQGEKKTGIVTGQIKGETTKTTIY